MHIAGKEFTSGGLVLILVCVGYIVDSAVGSVGYMNIMTGHPEYNMYANGLAVAINIIGNYLMIPLYGMYGAAVMTAVALATHNICNFILMYTRLHIHPFSKYYAHMVKAMILALFTAWLIKVSLEDAYFVIRLLTGAIVYFTVFVCMIFRFVADGDEKALIVDKITKIRSFRRS